jgi:hypothetical protein
MKSEAGIVVVRPAALQFVGNLIRAARAQPTMQAIEFIALEGTSCAA